MQGVIHLGQKTDTMYMVIIGWLVSSFIYLIGGVDNLFTACVILVVLDFVTGITSAWYTKSLVSRTALWGVVRKSLMLVPIIVAHQLDLIAGKDVHFMRDAMLVFLIATEGISIFENLGQLGLKYPSFIMTALIKVRGDSGKRRRKSD